VDAIKVEGLTKRYGKIEALRGVDLAVQEGTVLGLVGPNGAGKTTLIKALVGALRPSGGEVRVLGLNPLEDRSELRRQVGYMPQSPALYEDLSARGNVEFFGAAHRTPELAKKTGEVSGSPISAERVDDPVHTVLGRDEAPGLPRLRARPQAQMLILDEPTAAVDPQLRSRFWQDLQGARRGRHDAASSAPTSWTRPCCATGSLSCAGAGSSPPTPRAASRAGRDPSRRRPGR
jgi:ABC-2 type transport system ATP-binding protein